MAKASVKTARKTPRGPSLRSIVGPKVYGVWVDMLRRLVPGGRTHRLAPVVGAMLQYAADSAARNSRGRPARGSLAEALIFAAEGDEALLIGERSDDEESDDTAELVRSAARRLFVDAKVKYAWTNHRGDKYSLVDGALSEFVRWHAMPWE